MQQEELSQLKAYARYFGGIMGVWWILSFACFIGVLYEPAMSFAFDLSVFSIPFVAIYIVRYYREKVLNGLISFRRAFAFIYLVFFYATLILSIVQWLYFNYLDNGLLVTTMIERINSPEMAPMFEAYQMSKKELIEQMNVISTLRPIDLVFSFMWFDLFVCMIMSFLVALVSKRSRLL